MTDGFRFIAFSTTTGMSTAHAASAKDALRIAAEGLPDAAYIEVLDCGGNGKKVWTGSCSPTNPVPLYKPRKLHRTVYRGDGYSRLLAPIALVEESTS